MSLTDPLGLGDEVLEKHDEVSVNLKEFEFLIFK